MQKGIEVMIPKDQVGGEMRGLGYPRNPVAHRVTIHPGLAHVDGEGKWTQLVRRRKIFFVERCGPSPVYTLLYL